MQVDSNDLSALRLLRLSHNALEGAIPSWVGSLRSLQLLDLSYNKLSGIIPESFSSLEGLKVLPDGNARSSEAIFTYSNQLNIVYGAGRNFTWEYGDALTNAATYLDLSSNNLQGEIPHALAQLVGLKYLSLANNELEGELWPPFLENLTALETLDLSQNELSGSIPATLSPSVSRFNVSLNDLSGPIPSGNHFDSFTDISLFLPGNPGLCGAIIHKPCVGARFSVYDYVSFAGFGIGAAVGFFIVCAWSFLLKQKGPATRKAKYGLYNPRF